MSTPIKESLWTMRWLAANRWDDSGTREEFLRLLNEALGDTPDAEEEEPFRLTPLFPGPDFPVIGRPLMVDQIRRYVRASQPTWAAGVTIHHTSSPSLAQRPQGLLEQHVRNLRSYYMGLGWSAGPHFFIDEDQAWAFSPLAKPGVHAKSFNRSHVGIEMLGDYDREDPWSGRGLQVLTQAGLVVGEILRCLNLPKDAVNFHRDDPRTSKSCPGSRIEKSQFLKLIK